MKKVMRLMKGKGKEKEGEGRDRRSLSSLGSRSSNPLPTVPPSPMSLSRAPLRLLQSSSSLSSSYASTFLESGDPQSNKLHAAAARGDLEKVKKHLKKNDVNSVDGQGRSPLHLAAAAGHLPCLYHLVAHAAFINCLDSAGRTPLHKAVEGGHIEAVQFLLDKGAATDVPDGEGNTSVHAAVSGNCKDALAVILRSGANTDIINYDGDAPLHVAARSSDQDLMEQLLRAGALVSITSHTLVTPLMLAARDGNPDVVGALLEYNAKLEPKDAQGHTAFDYAKGNRTVINVLKSFDHRNEPVTSFPSKPPPEPPASEETLGMPVLGAAGGVPLDDNEEEGDGKMKDVDLGKEVDEDEDSWQDSSSCSPLPGDPVPLALVKTKGVFDLSKFMVGSDRESAGSGGEDGPAFEPNPEAASEPGFEAASEPTSRPNSFSPPPPAKPPRIYDTPEGEDDIVYNDPVDMEPRNQKEKEEEEELYESPVWSSSEIQSFAEQGRGEPPRPPVFQKPSLDEDSKLLPSDEVVQECLGSHLDTSNKPGALQQGREEMWIRALQQEHLSQEVEDDSMKQIPDNIDFSMEPDVDAGTDETDHQSNRLAENLTANSSQQKADIAAANSPSGSSSSRPLSPLKPAIPAKPSLAALAARRLSEGSQQQNSSPPNNKNTSWQSNNENTSLPADDHNTVLPTVEQKPFSIPVDLESPSLLKSTPLSSMEVLSDRKLVQGFNSRRKSGRRRSARARSRDSESTTSQDTPSKRPNKSSAPLNPSRPHLKKKPQGKVGRPKGSTEGRLDEKTRHRLEQLTRRLEEAEADCDKHEVEVGEKRDSLPLSERIDKPRMREVNKELRAMIANEEEKRSHLRGIIEKLKSQKDEHSSVIDNLISENDQLSREVLQSERERRKSCVKEEISEGKLRAVSCLKGGLIEELEDQNSMILEQSGTVASLQIQLEELTIKNQHLEGKNSRLKERLEEKMNANMEAGPKDNNGADQLLQKYENEKQRLRDELQLEIKRIKDAFEKERLDSCEELKNKDALISELEQSNKKLCSDFENMKNETNQREVELETMLRSGKEELSVVERDLKEQLEAKETEIQELKSLVSEQENIDGMKNQFQHMTDVYENKIETLNKKHEENIAVLTSEKAQLQQEVSEKSSMITHLRNDLQAINADIKTRLNTNNSELEANLEKKENEIRHLEKKCEDLICKIDEKNNLIKSLEREKTETEANIENLRFDSERESRTALSAKLENNASLIEGLQRELENALQENKNSKEKALEMFQQERAGLEEKANKESKELHNSLKDALAKLSAKENECQNLMSELQSEKQSLPRAEARFRENENRMKSELDEQRKQYEMQQQRLERLEKEHGFAEEKVEQGQVKLRLKEEELARNKEALRESELRVLKIEAFVSEQKERVKELEARLHQTDKEKESIQKRLIKTASKDDTNQLVVEELRHQQGVEANRLAKEKERVASLTSAVQRLEQEISSLKSAQYLETQKVRLMVSSLGEEVAREGKAREEAVGRAARLQEELDEERRTSRATVQELESQAERAKRERLRALEERQRLVLVEEELDVEKRQREEMERRLARDERQAEEQVEQSAKLQDLQLQLNLATKRNLLLEEKLAQYSVQLGELEDLAGENRELQQAVLKKDSAMEELEKRLAQEKEDAELRLSRTLDRLRGEYEVMARSAVSTRLRKMNSFLEERRQQQEEMEKNRENAARSIQLDLEERLAAALQDAGRAKEVLRRSEQERVELSQQVDRKEKQLRGETAARQQLELQLDRLANQAVVRRMSRPDHSAPRAGSLDTPVASPEPWRAHSQSMGMLHNK